MYYYQETISTVVVQLHNTLLILQIQLYISQIPLWFKHNIGQSKSIPVADNEAYGHGVLRVRGGGGGGISHAANWTEGQCCLTLQWIHTHVQFTTSPQFGMYWTLKFSILDKLILFVLQVVCQIFFRTHVKQGETE